MVIYFSGTGNSRYAAKLIAHELGDELVDAAMEQDNEEMAEALAEFLQ